jgi:hypothetical protein
MNLEQAKKLIGTPVIVKDEHGKDFIGGILQFVGQSAVPNWGLAVTVDRMPMQIKSLDQIRPREDKRIFKK